jgi:sterol desaturase/sphingolipid hydroxylase (fatty acid hydroxylase superfamily)
MERYFKVIGEGYRGYAAYLWQEITHPAWNNYFYWLTGISLFFFVMELLRPWRKEQPKFRQDFWLDAFYMYFNYFLFSLVLFAGLSRLGVEVFGDIIGLFGLRNIVAIRIETWPAWAQILLLFIVADFVQWWTHRLLHRLPWLWEFHKVHHSIAQMGFSGHLRYHWMETFVYKLTQFIPLSMLGYDVADLFALHMFTTFVGHFNHANITVSGRLSGAVLGGLIGLAIGANAAEIALFVTLVWYGMLATTAAGTAFGALVLAPAMRYIFNSPEMHIWHHAHQPPGHLPHGANFGLTLSLWDWVFRTAYLPHDGRDIRLGFPGVERFPRTFLGQSVHGFQQVEDRP